MIYPQMKFHETDHAATNGEKTCTWVKPKTLHYTIFNHCPKAWNKDILLQTNKHNQSKILFYHIYTLYRPN